MSLRETAEKMLLKEGDRVVPAPRVMSENEKKHWAEVKELQEKMYQPPTSEDILQHAINRGKLILEKRNRAFLMDEYNKELFRYLSLYFARDKAFPGDLSKGIFLIGSYGVGKSFPLLCFSGINCNVSFPANMMKPTNEIICAFQKDGAEGVETFQKGVVVIDEISENHDAAHYGNKTNVIQQLLESRYDLFVRTGIVTHATSNFVDFGDIELHYGPRVRSRVHEMFNIKKVEGPDRRKQK